MKTTIEATQEKLRKGLNTAANIITSTMGASGSTVIVTSSNGHLLITKDGVSVAKSIQLPDPFENIGAQLLISAANETVKLCGDGTTLTSLLLQQMVNHTKTIQDYDNLVLEVAELKEYILRNSKEVTTTEEIYNIAKTSANDEKVAELIKSIYDQNGFTTHIELEMPDDEKETSITVDKGFKLDVGFTENWQMTDTFKQEVRYDDPTFYITEEPIHHPSQRIKDLVRLAMVEEAPLVFVADKYSREFKSFIQAQVMSPRKAKILLLRMSDFFGEDKHHQFVNLKAYLSDTSTAQSIISNPYYTLIYNDDHSNLEPRLAELKSLSENVIDPLESRNFTKRYHQLAGNVATIWVGGNTKEEAKELYDRVEDAIGAASTAIQNGYVPGAGSVFTTFAQPLLHKFCSVWYSPMVKIAENAGYTDNPLELQTVHGEPSTNEYGFDINSGKLINLIDAGIVDPTNTLLIALDNALANTKLVLNTKYILHNEIQQSY